MTAVATTSPLVAAPPAAPRRPRVLTVAVYLPVWYGIYITK